MEKDSAVACSGTPNPIIFTRGWPLNLHKNLQHLGPSLVSKSRGSLGTNCNCHACRRRKGTDKLPAAFSSPRSPTLPGLGNQTQSSVGEDRERSLPSHLAWSLLTHRVREPQPGRPERQRRPQALLAQAGQRGWATPTPARWRSGFRGPEAKGSPPPRPSPVLPPVPPLGPRPVAARGHPGSQQALAPGPAAPSSLPHPARGRASGGDVKGRAVAAPPRALVKKKKKRGSET